MRWLHELHMSILRVLPPSDLHPSRSPDSRPPTATSTPSTPNSHLEAPSSSIYPPMHLSFHPCQPRHSPTRARHAIRPLVPDAPIILSCQTRHPIRSRHVNPILMYTSFLDAFLYASQDTTTTFLPRPASPIWIGAVLVLWLAGLSGAIAHLASAVTHLVKVIARLADPHQAPPRSRPIPLSPHTHACLLPHGCLACSLRMPRLALGRPTLHVYRPTTHIYRPSQGRPPHRDVSSLNTYIP